MAGHSKWAQIKRQKGVADQKRGAVFSKLANAITIAARNGTDPEMNFQLRIAIDKAKAANMPKDNIERAIDRVKGANAAAMEEIMFEAYGPGGTAFLIESATDNRNRTVGEIRAALNKHDGKLAESGSVGYLFNKRGQIILENVDIEAAELAAIDAGADDVETDGTTVFIYTNPKELEAVRQSLATAGFTSNEIGFVYQPLSTVPVADQKVAERVLRLSDMLEEIDDVTAVHSNVDIPSELLQ